MTTTPTIWKATYFPTLAGGQRLPQTIGLKDGRILTVWEDQSSGPGAGIDIMGRFATAEGVGTGSVFQINHAITSGDETEPRIAAMPDGGFVVAWGGFLEATGGFICVERFTATGAHVASNFITSPTSSLFEWEIVADSDGDYTVVFERGPQIDLRSVTYSAATNAPGPERTNLGQNAGDDDELGDIAVLPNGRIVTIYNEPDFEVGEYQTVEFAVVDPATGLRTRPPQQIAGEGGVFISQPATAESVVVLTGGQIVLAYSGDFGGSFRICASEAPGSAIGPEIYIGRFNVELVALRDGGFFAAWTVAGGGIEGRRYDFSGNEIGGVVTIDATGGSLEHLSLTSDGRIVVPFIRGGAIAQAILDPREGTITGTGLGETITTQIFGTDLSGDGGDDILLGQGGNDTLNGGTGHDTLKGRGGADFLNGDAGNDTLEGGAGNDSYFLDDANSGLFGDVRLYDTVSESAGGGADTVFVRALNVADIGADGYTLGAHVEIGFVDGTFGPFVLTGNDLDNALTGHDLANTLAGLSGNDRLDGGAGADALDGGEGADTLIGGSGNDSFVGGAGVDTAHFAAAVTVDLTLGGPQNTGEGLDTFSGVENLIGSALGDTLSGDALDNRIDGGFGNDTLEGHAAHDTLLGGAGNDAIYGEAGNDTLDGGAGLDRLYDGATDDVVFGGADADQLFAGPGLDRFDGGDGNDRLYAHAASADTFVFASAIGIDRVFNFLTGIHNLEIDAEAFGGAAGSFVFRANPKPFAPSATRALLYDTDDGKLWFDADGNGAGARVHVLTLVDAPTLAAGDIVLV